MSQPFHTLTAVPVQYTLLTRVFGAVDSPNLKTKLEKSFKDLIAPVERLFLNEAAVTAAVEKAGVEVRAASFVTFSTDAAHMKRWEHSADIRVIAPAGPGNRAMVEANLQSLTRDFGACMAIPLLYGKDFLNRYQQLLEDFWTFDNDLFPLLMIGIPPWAPFEMIKRGRAAQARILREMEALYRRIDQYQRGERVDFGADMSDVSSTAFERNRVYVREGWSFTERAWGDFGMLWGQNANTHPVLFWLLVYVYSTPGLLDRVRAEVAPYVCLSQADPPEITSMDLSALSRNCQLLKASIFETYRLVNEPTSIRYVTRPMTVNDGEFKHQLRSGMFVSAPLSLINRDPLVFSDPERFIPERFLEVDSETGKSVARYGRLRPWGTGPAMCKGRTFAEREIMSLGAAIISIWDIAPASGTWELPAMIPGTGVKKPEKDVRVVISRRTV
ncbi:cytochrome P450, putative [Metarhizium acridum CQMa 102]|uniref:Cytochrome P450, putative n=1 Tax=Metarhizium acridum (strain CQMa 102) TaxID=655827 RepID=E9DUB4_METAQ|nr:cytochrome P450, putative [Metarhizium acridum CQMa 102]EFY92576.1 cytochrome P450, putative [Metarhizium acridum CQMa 102]